MAETHPLTPGFNHSLRRSFGIAFTISTAISIVVSSFFEPISRSTTLIPIRTPAFVCILTTTAPICSTVFL